MVLVFVFLYAPIVLLIVFSFNSGNSNMVWKGFSLHWYTKLFRNRIIMQSVYTPLLVSLLATIIATVAGTFAAIGFYAMRRRVRNPLMTVNNIPMMNADIVTGVSMCLLFVAFFSGWGSLSFIAFHIVRMAIVLYLPTLAMIQVLPSLNPVLVTLLVGLFCVAYTSIGGIEAVLWSDAIEAVILILGAVLLIVVCFFMVGVGEGFSILARDGKMIGPDFFSLDLAKQSIWAMVIGAFFGSIYQYIGGQDIVQRYNTTPNESEAKKSLFYNIPLSITSSIIFIGMGSACWILFHSGKANLPENISGNSILPYVIIDYLPVGISGLIIAAIFAAAQSTVSSSLNSVSTTMTRDILEKLKPDLSDKFKLNFARASSWIVGLISTLLTGILRTYFKTEEAPLCRIEFQ